MDKIEKIRQEIERRSHGEQGFNSEDAEYGYRSCARDLLSFLDTLSEEPDNEDLNEEIKRFVAEHGYESSEVLLLIATVARHFAKWGTEHSPLPEDTVLFQKGVEEGKRLMMEGAVEGYVNYYEDSGGILMAEAQVGCPYHNGDKIRLIVLPKEDKK